MKLKRLMAAMTFVAAGVATAHAVAAGVDPAIPAYAKTTGVSGNLSSVGSDTLANLMTLWAESYKRNTRTSTSRFKLPAPPLRHLR